MCADDKCQTFPIQRIARVDRQSRNLTFQIVAPEVPVRTEVTVFPLKEANEALLSLREGKLQGAAVLEM